MATAKSQLLGASVSLALDAALQANDEGAALGAWWMGIRSRVGRLVAASARRTATSLQSADLDEVCDELAVALLEKLRSSGRPPEFRRWLVRVVRNRVVDQYRARIKAPRLASELADDSTASGVFDVAASANGETSAFLRQMREVGVQHPTVRDWLAEALRRSGPMESSEIDAAAKLLEELAQAVERGDDTVTEVGSEAAAKAEELVRANVAPKTWQIYVLHEKEGLTFQEVAARLGIEKNIAKVYYYRVLKKVKAALVT